MRTAPAPSAAGSSVRCRHCDAPIATRHELEVVGRALAPVHVRCRRAYAATHPWWARPGLPVNRWGSLLVYDAGMLALVLLLHGTVGLPAGSASRLLLILGLSNAWLLLAHLVAHRTIVRHVPAADAPRRG